MLEDIKSVLAKACWELYGLKTDVELHRTEEQFGDFSTNIALKIAGLLKKLPMDLAHQIADEISEDVEGVVSGVTVANPGFINFRFSDGALWQQMDREPSKLLKGKTVVVEYSDPNPFKVLHAGHVYTTVVGDAIANLLEAAGATVHRVNFGGDVGLHVAKTMWAILQQLGGENPVRLTTVVPDQRSQWLADRYVEGNRAYTDDPHNKQEIVSLNKKIYQIQTDDDHASSLAQIYWETRQWSYEAFDRFYNRLGTTLDRYYPESEVAQLGLDEVKKHIGTVFEKSDGAIVFNGEDYGLHTRVFINREGLPTYETKDVGLILKKYSDYTFDKSVVITGNEQAEYMAVVLKAIEQFLPKLAAATTYIGHGMLRLTGGIKMSSRLGNIVPANEVIDLTAKANQRANNSTDEQMVLGAIKYAFLRIRIGGDILYNPAESVAIEGNSGPYLQYAHARARSILAKAPHFLRKNPDHLDTTERSLVRKLAEYSDVVNTAMAELRPHYICTYLYELSQKFNQFYENNRVIDDPREALRLQIVDHYANTLQAGLSLLNIRAPHKV